MLYALYLILISETESLSAMFIYLLILSDFKFRYMKYCLSNLIVFLMSDFKSSK